MPPVRLLTLLCGAAVTSCLTALAGPATAAVPAPASSAETSSAETSSVETRSAEARPVEGSAALGSTVAAHEGRTPTARPSATTLAAGTTVRGLDVSHWQGTVDWPSVRAEGARFTYMKATEGTGYTDPQFRANYTGSYAAGLVRGAYHFALPDRSSGRAQADFFVDHGGGWSADGRTLPPLLDIEYDPYGPTCYGLTPAAMVRWVRDFSDQVKARTGRSPALYTTANWWTTCTGDATGIARTDPLFVARYSSAVGTLPAGWTRWRFWQFADSGTFPGDQDLFQGTMTQLRAFATG